MVSNLALFCLATVLATFQKIGQFFPNHLVTLAPALTSNIRVELKWLTVTNNLAYFGTEFTMEVNSFIAQVSRDMYPLLSWSK